MAEIELPKAEDIREELERLQARVKKLKALLKVVEDSNA